MMMGAASVTFEAFHIELLLILALNSDELVEFAMLAFSSVMFDSSTVMLACAMMLAMNEVSFSSSHVSLRYGSALQPHQSPDAQ